MRRTETDDAIRFELLYVTADVSAIRTAMRTTAQVGLCVLDIFRLIYRERMEIQVSGVASMRRSEAYELRVV